jgi:hypothetical protein
MVVRRRHQREKGERKRRARQRESTEFDCQRSGRPWATNTTTTAAAALLQRWTTGKSQCTQGGSWQSAVGEMSRPHQGSLRREDGCAVQWAASWQTLTRSQDATDECDRMALGTHSCAGTGEQTPSGLCTSGVSACNPCRLSCSAAGDSTGASSGAAREQ